MSALNDTARHALEQRMAYLDRNLAENRAEVERLETELDVARSMLKWTEDERADIADALREVST